MKSSTARGANNWEQSFRLWDTYFAVVWLATLVFVLGTNHPGWPVRLTAAALLLPLIPMYVGRGRVLLQDDPPHEQRSLRYLLTALALFLPSAILVGETRLMTFALIPQCFMTLRLRWALTAVTVINIAPVVGWALLWWPSDHDVFFNVVFALVTLVFSVALGSWVIKVMEQSQERAELIAELDTSRLELSRLSTAHGALTERERMAREIHDTLAQGFTSLLMLTQAVEAELDHDLPQARRHLSLMTETARQNLAEARALVAGGAPADLEGASLPDALRRLAARNEAALTVTGSARPLPPGPEVVALRACQEALANARKHAGSGATVAIELTYEEGRIALSVRDEGSGFDMDAVRSGYGLAGLSARATEAGGTVRVRSAPGEGTTVTVLLPALPLLLRSDP
ncbi:sensor histidine kinase [Streptomyces sp. NBC_00576]|uniref:sensor histidine kinase n=1 Tax=Streptomyces sp. NBC_00576 TaxID=2903665 RepID=UPI002E7FD68E|nr:sensor histidine kinase [Streptomyces sp. NBC_00576]WUB75804.1 sensor histidine kinase [Streptomyces sp. NBC_00576]